MTFAAAHRYRRDDWSEEKNRAVFGASANPNFHGHNYACDVTVPGDVDPDTGMIVDLGRLDVALATEVRGRFDQRNINLEVAAFADGKLIPTGENLARYIFERMQHALGGFTRVTRVVVREDDTLWAEYVA